MTGNDTFNLLHVCLAEGYGGLEKFFLNSSGKLADEFNTTLLVKENSRLNQRLQDTNLDYRTLDFFNYADIKSTLKIRNLVKELETDVVYFHGSTELGLIVPALIGLDATLLNRKSVIVSSSKKDFYHRLIYRGVDNFVAPSTFYKENLIEKYPVSPDDIEVIPNAIDLKQFEQDEYSEILSNHHPKNDHKFITTLSRLIPVKGTEKFVKFANVLAEQREDYVFFIVGEGSDDYLKKLKTLRNDRFSDRIIFTGFQEDVPAVLNETDLFVTFAWKESFGNNILEAKASGIPIMASPSPGAKYQLTNHEEFLIDKKDDLDTLAGKATGLLEDYSSVEYDLYQYRYDHYVSKIRELTQQNQS